MVVVGNLDGIMSNIDLRAHMRDIHVNHTADVIEMNGLGITIVSHSNNGRNGSYLTLLIAT